MAFGNLTEDQLDALKEISNIGMGHAATALSQMIGDTVLLRVPKVTVTEIAEVPDFLGGAENLVVGVTLKVLGDARGRILLIFPTDSARRLISGLLAQPEESGDLSDLGISTLKEVGNILASAYLNALGSLLHLTLIPSIPLLAHDMAGAVVDSVLIELSEVGDLALMVETEFHGRGPRAAAVKGHFFLLPDPSSLELILDVVGGKA